jgi:hypothetical protein
MGPSDNLAERCGSGRKWGLPRHLGVPKEDIRSPGLENAPHAEWRQSVLVIDDEPSVRMLITEVLGELGYDVIEASDGPSGLAIVRSGARINLLISDVALPNGLNGGRSSKRPVRSCPG